ncbi:MAG TPA: MarR family transcriptional regulator [Gaiellaceae bacterium]|nr:MarR family transcriptional regulator [Gaiellaceae bacterium]
MKDSNVKGNSRQELIGRFSLAIRASQNISEAFDEHVAARLGVNRTDMRALDILDQRGPISAGELAEAMHLSSGAITTLVDRLERTGWARRRRDPEDRRRVLIEPGSGPGEQIEAFYMPLFHGTAKLLEAHSDGELLAMIEFMEQGRAMVERELRRLEAEG